VYAASHDLQAPITNIEGLLQVVRDEAAGAWNDTADYALRLMQDAVERFRATLTHLPEVTSVQPDATRAAPVNVAEVYCWGAVGRGSAAGRPRPRGGSGAPGIGSARAPAKTLRSVVYNLLSNALKYHHPDRPAEVHLRG